MGIQIKLPDYKEIASQARKRPVEVTKEDIEKLKQAKERMEAERLRSETLEKIAEKTEVGIPVDLIEAEKNRMLQVLKLQVPQLLQISFEDYLKRIGKTEKEILDSFLLEAQKRVKTFLVLREIGKRENIEATKEELDQNQSRGYTKEMIEAEKTFQFLEGLSQNP